MNNIELLRKMKRLCKNIEDKDVNAYVYSGNDGDYYEIYDVFIDDDGCIIIDSE